MATQQTNKLLIDSATVAVSETSSGEPLGQAFVGDVMATITGANPANKTFISGTAEVDTLTFPTKAGSTGGDYVVFYDYAGSAWAAGLNKSGVGAAPTGAAWAAIAAGKKTFVDISAATSAADVAAAVETALNALSGFTSVITTDDSAADGTMSLTNAAPGPVTNPVPHNANDSGAGSIRGVETTAGVASKVDVAANTVSIASHGFLTGMKFTLTTTGTLPAGLSLATPYYVIKVDADTIKVASSQANALAGTAVDITDYGTGTHTVVVTTTLAGAVKLQKSDEPFVSTALQPASDSWIDINSSSQSFSAAGNINWVLDPIGYNWLRAVVTVTSGTVTSRVRLNAKGV